jgi:hypothetical protein
MSLKCVEIVGTSPAFGGHYALQVGFAVKVYEDRRDGGLRLDEDFQGIENWSLEEDVAAETCDCVWDHRERG